MSSSTRPSDIHPDELAAIQDILQAHLPVGTDVWVFGSRANWTTKPSSDLDLAVEGAEKIDGKILTALAVAFDESNLPYTVDLVDMKALSQSFRRRVEMDRTPLPVADGGRSGPDP